MKLLLVGLLALSATAFAAPKTHWVTVDSNILERIAPFSKDLMVEAEGGGASLVELTDDQIEMLSAVIHHELHKCGGFIAHDSKLEGLTALQPRGDMHFGMKGMFADYAIDQQSTVAPWVTQVSADKIVETITSLANFHNRYYKSQTGKDSQKFLLDTWKRIAGDRSDVKVEYFTHSGWPQPSVILTIEGSDLPNEIVILGGHADSISGWFGQTNNRAPGADDNASGIATITEALRIAMANNFKPKRTVQFMAYAAEEVGLYGSKEIANKYKTDRRNVVGSIQFDMTLFKGTPDKDIVMMTDFTNQAQNEFLGKLIDEYVKVPWGYSKCGYGCSDHASWTNAGFPASIPFEATMENDNKAIHTERDTLQTAGGNGLHAAKFAKLALAYMVELSN